MLREIDDEEANFYCTEDEGDFFDRKAFEIRPANLEKIVVAFANSDGGEVLVGIKDEKHEPDPLKRWVGADSREAYNQHLDALIRLNPTVDFKHVFLKRKSMSRNYVLKISVGKGLEVHEASDKSVYVRKGAQSLVVRGAAKLMELAYAKGKISAEDNDVENARIDDIEKSPALTSYIAQLPITDKDPLSFLLQENLFNPETWIPKTSSVLLFSENPSALMRSQCAIRIVRYDTQKDDIDRDALTSDIFSIEAPLHLQVSEALKKIKEMLDKCNAWSLNGYQPISFPDEALWEILVNSVIHRDYSISDNVLVSIFNNRVEIKSPGRLPGLVTVNNILDNRASRNPKLVRLLSKYRSTPNKDLGEGMNTAFQRMRDFGFVEPVVQQVDNYVIVTLYHRPNKPAENLVLTFIENHGSINNAQLRDLAGVLSPEQATAIFGGMKDRNLIRRLDESTGAKVKWVKA
ncbi:putative transcriptional regulator [Pseudomonas sp. GM41(2012)]|uniref:ATP-binding protein n=1 Tax=Pseudomonas sp. (strain GM41(2012)) TaxID=1144708 RepID=UPI00027043B2|nr:ATP-binding protein [Pseudomonas sp. GM41(2012)]EUB75544.1 putative transcriptional regulator [Pseudomonas sp. GM41(2012)]